MTLPRPLLSLLVVAAGFVGASPYLAAQQATPEDRAARAAEADDFRAHLDFLADDALEGRAPGTRGGELAALYIKAQFERLGLEPAGDSGTYYHRVPIISLTPDPTLGFSADGGTRDLAYRDDYVLWAMRNEPRVTVTAPAVFVGYGIVAPEHDWDDYAGVDVQDKVVVMFVNDPGLRDSTLFRGDILTYYGRWTYKLEEAARQGAAGVLLVHTTESATYPWTTVASSWTGPQVRVEQPPTPLQFAGWIDSTAAASILPGGNVDSLMRAAATRGFRAMPLDLTVTAVVQSDIERSETFNVMGRLPGNGPHAGEVVLIGAHYDHLGIGAPVDGDSIYNGAEDNASGTAAMLAAAEALVRSGVQPDRAITFVAFAAEESGLLGSTALAQRPPVPLGRIAAVLNMDVMNLYGPTRDIAALGLDLSSLGPIFTQAAAAEELRVVTNRDALIKGSFYRSDHFPMARAGVPAISLETGSDYDGRPEGWGREQQERYTAERYHQPSDEILPWFNAGGAMQQLRVVLRTAVGVANTPEMPTWREGTEFQAAGQARKR